MKEFLLLILVSVLFMLGGVLLGAGDTSHDKDCYLHKMISCASDEERHIDDLYSTYLFLVATGTLQKGSKLYGPMKDTTPPGEHVIFDWAYYVTPNNLRGFEIAVPSGLLKMENNYGTVLVDLTVQKEFFRQGLHNIVLQESPQAKSEEGCAPLFQKIDCLMLNVEDIDAAAEMIEGRAKEEADARDACLRVAITALGLEKEKVQRELERSVREDKREKLEQRLDEVQRRIQEYSTMRPEDYEMPEPLTVIGRLSGNEIHFLGLSRSGPFFHSVGESPNILPDTRYKFKIYPVCRRWYPFPSWYVWIGHAERAEVVTLADYLNVMRWGQFDVNDLTQVYVWKESRCSSSSDPQLMRRIGDLLRVLPYEEHLVSLKMPRDTPVLNVDLVTGEGGGGELRILGDRLCGPPVCEDYIDKERELVDLIKGIVTEESNNEYPAE